MKKPKKMSKNISKPRRSKQIPVTVEMLYEVRDQLCDRMDGIAHDLKSEIHEVKSEVHGIKSEIHGIKSEIHGIKSEIHEVKSEVSGLKSEMHRLALLMEEQNARNIYVLDGLTSLFHRQDRLEHGLK